MGPQGSEMSGTSQVTTCTRSSGAAAGASVDGKIPAERNGPEGLRAVLARVGDPKLESQGGVRTSGIERAPIPDTAI